MIGGINLYTYVLNNPIKYYDFVGLTASTVDAFCGRYPRGCAEIGGRPPRYLPPPIIGFSMDNEGEDSSADVIPFPQTEGGECEDEDDDINCIEWLGLLNQQYLRILIMERAGGDTSLLKIQHNESVDLFCSDPDCGYLCPQAQRF